MCAQHRQLIIFYPTHVHCSANWRSSDARAYICTCERARSIVVVPIAQTSVRFHLYNIYTNCAADCAPDSTPMRRTCIALVNRRSAILLLPHTEVRCSANLDAILLCVWPACRAIIRHTYIYIYSYIRDAVRWRKPRGAARGLFKRNARSQTMCTRPSHLFCIYTHKLK